MINKAAKIKILISVPGRDQRDETKEAKATKVIDQVIKASHTYLQAMNKSMASHPNLQRTAPEMH